MSLKLIPGEWYVAGSCKECNWRILVFPDLSNGKGSISGSFVLDCPQCQRQESFAAEHYQCPEKMKAALA